MRKMYIILLISFGSIHSFAQPYYNEWIDYSKTYYKFKVGQTGLYRINQQNLPAALQSAAAEQFQLWRNGKEVAIYTSVASGVLPANGYIEFLGEKNDGLPDRNLYKDPNNQLSTDLSLETDTATYFLTINTGGNLRITDDANNVAGTSLSPEQSFIYHYHYDFQDMLNRGRAVYYGTNVYSSTYDIGEWWSSKVFGAGITFGVDAGDLHAANSTVQPQLNISFAGTSVINGNNRIINVGINGATVISDNTIIGMDAKILSNSKNISLSSINSSNTTFSIKDDNSNLNDGIVAGFIDLEYNRQFNFGGATQFAFSLPATSKGNFLKITNFSSSNAMLYDLTNNKRYAANTSIAGTLQFVLPPSASDRNLVLVSEDEIHSVINFTQRIFPDFSVTANQGNYLIISNKILINSGTGVQSYAAYRAGAAGGSYNTKIYDIDDLVDEFAYGIKMHPLSVKNFLRFARNKFAVPPQFAFLIGKAVTYNDARANESSSYYNRLNLVPTFGWPASDNVLASDDLSPIPATHIGRLSAVTQNEVQIYLTKIIEYEKAQQNTSETIADKAWMKNMIHVIGADDISLNNILSDDMYSYKSIITDTLYGANVYTFNKTTSTAGATVSDALLQQLFDNGISLINYFGHSSASILDYNLNEPKDYNNPLKYPVFIVNGCDAGDIFSFDTARFSSLNSLSEQWVLASGRGSIAYLASTHFGIESFLDAYNTGFYNSLAHTNYGAPLSYNIKDAITYLLGNPPGDLFTATLHAEENVLHGDPALKIDAQPKPDFAIEAPDVIITPTFISAADNSFKVKCYFYNLGKATGDSVSVLITRKYPDGSTGILFSQKIKSVRYIDSVELSVPIIASRDKGANSLTVTIDNTNEYDELSELNNTVTKDFFIYEDELTPVYPYNFSIVNKSNIKLYASTANPIVPMRNYVMEMDTTELFNSSAKITQTIASVGGVIEFNSTLSFIDSTVYYWRVAPVPTNGVYIWNVSSFVYLPNAGFGYNQSHLYQHLKSTAQRIYIDSFSRKWTYRNVNSILDIYNAVQPAFTQDAAFRILINNNTITSGSCLGNSVIFNLFNPLTLQPYFNQTNPSTTNIGIAGGFMGSYNGSCTKTGNQYNFQYSFLDTASRRKMRDFMDWIPAGTLVTVRLINNVPYSQTAATWKADQTVYGDGNTFYDRLKQSGFAQLDSFSFPRTWIFDYEKNNTAFIPEWKFSQSISDLITYRRFITSSDTLGFITSPKFGPAKAWKNVLWNGYSLDAKPGDNPTVDVIGVDSTGNQTVLYTLNTSQQNFNISSVSVTKYPYLQLRMRNADSIHLTPYQLRWWRILYDPVPEGALAPNILYSFKDTVSIGQTDSLAIAFKNISEVAFADSILVNLTLYDANNVASNIAVKKIKALQPGDTAVIRSSVATGNLTGLNNLYLDVNPNNNQPEQTHFNNFMYKNFAVTSDNYKPVLDVTFDGIHILNNDIVAAKPHVLIKMKDESGYLLLNDTSLFNVQLRYPDGTLRPFYFNTDTLLFTAATSGSNNVATVDFTPYLTDDGTYQLIVHGKDKTGNTAGNVDYTVSFDVLNKPMISNMFNYPNPFTTSTAFVFTITGSEVPQNIRIQILTITGKIVREITKEQLGELHIGRNITDYKWDGTDQYGDVLANGVYLYRVLTNLNGKSLDKFATYGKDGYEVNTDKYFNKGYGKMYLMR